MRRFRLSYMFIVVIISWVDRGESSFELDFITWPNETQAVVNETVKFLWRYHAKETDVFLKWGISERISPKVSSFYKVFFFSTRAKNAKSHRPPVMSEQIPERYKRRVRIVNQATLQIVNVTIEDEGDYLCEISDYPAKWKTLSRAVKLHVLVPPKIVSHPPDTRLLREGEEIRLGCKATGRPIPEVSWYNGSIELTKGVKKDKGSAEYINPNVSRWDNGNYKCVAKNNASQVEYTVQVIVRYKPFGTKIKTDAKSDTLERGEDLKIVCEACSKPPPIFNLYHYSEVGVKTEIVKVQNNTKGEFYIRNIKPSQRGKYSCVPHNDVGAGTEAIVRVRVRFSPVIKRIAARRTNLTKGENLVIWCDTEGYPIPRIKWTNKYGRIISNDRTFRKNNVNENDDGLYTCTTNNGIFPSANKSVYINVFYRPVIDLQKSSGSKHALKGGTVFLRCNATGNPTPTYEWKKGSRVIASEPSTSLDGLKNDDFGKYTCFVRNFVGVTTHEVKVFRIDKPSITELHATELNSRFVHIQWKIHGDTQFSIKKQELVCISKENNAVMVNKTMTGHRRSEKIKDLKPFTTYEVRLKVWNEYVPSDPKKLKFQTKTATPGPPGQPRIQFLDTTSVRVTWDPPKETNGELLQYRLFYRIANDSSTEKLNNVSGSETSLKVVLKRNVEYIFKVKAVTSSGPGKFSREKYFLMVYQAPVPEPPNVTRPSANVYRLIWNNPKSAGNLVKVLLTLTWRIKHLGKIDKDKREIFVGGNDRSRTRRDVKFDWKAEIKEYGTKRELDLKDLFPNTIYMVTIKEGLKVNKGMVLWSKEITKEIITPEGVPSQPRDLTVDMLNDSSFMLSWKRPFYIGGKLTKYVVSYETGGKKEEKELKSGLKNETVTMIVETLSKKKKYDVQLEVQANGEKPGLKSNILEFKKGSGILIMNIDSTTEGSFTISWNKPSVPSITIDDYKIYYRTSNENWKFMHIRSGLNNETLSARVNGLPSGKLYKVKVQARSKHQVFLSEMKEISSAIVQARESDETDYVPMFGGIIAGVLIFAFVIIILAMFVRYNYRKRQRNQRRSGQGTRGAPNVLITRENGHTHMSSPSDHLSSDSPGSEKYLRPEKKGNSVQVPLKVLSGSTKPIPVLNLLEYCTDHRKNGNKGFAEEFKSIDTEIYYSYEECKKPVNKSKNRYANIVTYDHTRVCLSNLGDNGSDYINANYIDGYNCPEKFIATQGPAASTFNDFWRMVWEQNCSAIVMVTNLVEKGKVKCQKYWPVTEAELFGSLTVNPIEEWELTDYTIRKFQLQQNNNTELTRDVTQFHYTAWPDHGVPVHPSRLLAFIKRVKNYFHVTTGKIVVHCSAGVGRTGTFIALDGLLDQMRDEGVVDIYKFVSHMRTQRSTMVQTEAQYSFIYEAILEASVCSDTEISVPEFMERLRALEQDDDVFSREFENLAAISVVEKETCVNGLMPENQKKNRHNSILPYDSTRIKLWPYPNEKGSDYINASFIDGYRNREIFIATQAPIKESIEDFWRMIWEYECYVLVMLVNVEENEEFQFLQYWPSEGEEYIIFGLLMIEIESEEEFDSHVQRVLKCTNTKNGEVRKLYHLNFVQWSDHGVPASVSHLLNFLKEVVKLEQRTGNGLTLVHCSDGSGRVGTFITIYIALERMKLESIVDVFSVVRNLRTQRIGMVANIKQYKFCYHALGEHIRSPNCQPY